MVRNLRVADTSLSRFSDAQATALLPYCSTALLQYLPRYWPLQGMIRPSTVFDDQKHRKTDSESTVCMGAFFLKTWSRDQKK